VRFLLAALALLGVSACASQPVERTVYDNPQRYEERRPIPGEIPRYLPPDDGYRRQRHVERS
jgi:hypothetical protein